MGKITRFYQQSGVVLGALFIGYQSVSADDHLIEINRVAAKVNNEIVTWGEIDRAMTSLNFTNSEKKERAPEFVDGKVDRLLSIYAFNDKGMAIPDSYIEQEYNKRLIQEFNGDRRLFRDVLRSKGMSQMEYRDSIREEIIYQHMMATRRRLKEDVSPDRVEEFYKKNEHRFRTDQKIKLKEIVFSPIADEPLSVLMQQARKVRGDIAAGEKFEDVAKKQGQSPYREDGGDWGVMTSSREIRSQEIREQAFELKEGDISQPFKVELLERKADGSVGKSGKLAVYILKADKVENSDIRPLEEVRDEIENLIAQEIEASAQRKWLTNVKADAYVRINLPE